MVHWSDLLYKNAQHSDRNFDFDKLYNEQPHVKAVAKDLKIYADGMIDDVRRIALGSAGTAIDWMKEQFDINDVANWGLEKTAKDLAFYYDPKRRILDRKNRKCVARKVLMDELRVVLEKNKNRRCMVIAHSMGTIIAYDVLRDLGRKANQNPGFRCRRWF